MKKRILSVLLCLCMVLTLFQAEALAEELADLAGTVPAGTQGDPHDPVYQVGSDTDIPNPGREISPYADEKTVTYTLDNGARLTVTAAGTITGGSPGSDGAIIIPEEIPIDGNGTGKTIAVTSIGVGAFSHCSSLTSVTIPDGVASIEDSAFYNCDSLTNVTIPDSVTSIGWYAFSYCSSLISITIPDSVASIGSRAFFGCSDLTGVTIPSGVTSIKEGVFAGCSSLTSVTIPSGVTCIEVDAFAYCSSLTNVTIPSGVASIEDWAFLGCGDVTVDSENPNYRSDNGVLFDKGKTILIHCSVSKTGAYTIPSSVASIGDAAFHSCSGLTGVTIPSSVTSIGLEAFRGCSGLTGVTFQTGVTSIGNFAFQGCSGLTSVTIPSGVTSIGDFAFHGCSGLTSVTIPSGVTNIGGHAFADCSGLTSITIPDGVTSIGDGAFSSCSGLTSITIPDSVTSIGNGAFGGFIKLADVYYGGSEAQWKSISFGNYNTYLTDAAIHYNSAGPGMGSAGEEPTPDKPGRPAQDTDDSVTPHTIVFYSGISQKSMPIDIEWGWRLLLYGYSPSYENSLAVAGLALSGAAEYWDVSAEWTLRNLGFNTVASYNYDKNLFDWYHPGVTFGYQKIICGGEERHMFAVVVRGSTDPEDWISDSFADGFYQSGINVYAQLQDFIEQKCGLTYNEIKSNSRFFITGHSLGGAAANIAAQLLNISYGRNNVFAYTFASPKNVSDKSETELRAESNIFNTLNSEDWVTTNWHPDNTGRYGQDMQFSRISSIPWGFNTHFQTLTGKRFSNDSAHAIEVYMSYLMTRAALEGKKAVVIHVFCPVDAEVYASNGQLVGSITDNVAGNVIEGKVYIYIENDEKYLYLLDDDEYTIKLTGTDEGIMTYSVQNIDALTGNPEVEQTFQNVALIAEKQFVSEVKVGGGIATDVETQEVKLYVLGSDGTPEKEVLPDGNGTEIPIDTPPIPVTCTITFIANSGAVTPTTLTTDEEGRLAWLPTPVRDGYAFDGWFTALTGGDQITVNTVFTNDAAVYARWTYRGGIFGENDWYPPADSTIPTTYRITVPAVSGGTVAVSPKSAAKGSTVTLTATADEGYELASLTATDSKGSELELTGKGDGRYTFIMPGSTVTVSAVFKPIEDQPAAPAAPDWANPFTDVSVSAWYYDAVKFVNTNSLMNGIEDNLFAPDANLSRAQLAQILYNKEGKPAVSGGSAFADVDAGAWYADAVRWAAANHIAGGYGSGLFGPDDNVTREQLAVMLWRYAGEPMSVREISFSDADQISGFAQAAVRWAVENGILNGKGGNILDPKGFAARAEAAQMLKNYLDN